MGTWGFGLYANDEASDLKELLKAVLRLPLDMDELVDLMTQEMGAREEDFNFWLVLADQFEKKGLKHLATTERALSIIANQADIAELRALGMPENDLISRGRDNQKMMERLLSPRPEKPRKTLRSPQKPVVNANDIIAFPTQAGKVRNPYLAAGSRRFDADGWGLFQVNEVGHEFGYLGWISVFPLSWPHAHCPTFEEARSKPVCGFLHYGTLSKSHYKKMEIQILGNADPRTCELPPGAPHTSRSLALSDVSISNAFNASS